MADFSMVHTGSVGAAPSRLLHALRETLAGMWEGYVAYRTYQVLNSMSDYQLGQIGLKRSDIAREAMFGSRHRG